MFAGLCDKLFDIDDKLQIVPQLATSYEYADPKTLVIHLRTGVKFQDGTVMDAAAVKYSLDRHLTMAGSARRARNQRDGPCRGGGPADRPRGAEGAVRAVPVAADRPCRDDRVAQGGGGGGQDFALHPVCAGPMKFVERVAQDRIVLERFADYWNKDAIHVDRVVYQPIPDSSVRLANLQAGSVDLVEYIVPTDTDAVSATPS